ncbi:hypothetical protein CW676_12185 [Macrococcoides caseolyticum]|nr:hypothetical protein CW692_12005 [Macrococcus caseolyticus]PKE22908.1 hypothetical protein CW689_12010 [Macrococcus caseolyticus]PKE51810.1 hypothetical protein CW676_12185 [Macrococcus caseolyticus]PKF37412.1 hypothetical protein CW681_12250 [Macrococcus caseolyticus]PNZ71407.1 hypothetical protein CD152_09835 [Macrococcus caseolyticus]
MRNFIIIINILNYLFFFSLFSFLLPETEGYIKLFIFSISSSILLAISVYIYKKEIYKLAYFSAILNLFNALVVPVMVIVIGFMFPN